MLERVHLPLGKVLYESGDTQMYGYFPIDAIVSLLYVTAEGSSSEISIIGNDGIVGVALFMDATSSLARAVVQSEGAAYRLPAQKLKDEFNRHGEMLILLLRYTQTLITQMAQTAVCNRHHSIKQQLCRLLLLWLDRLPGREMSMTQELIASMLGVIRYSRGRIEVLNRKHLEELCCECYGVVERECDRLLPHRMKARRLL